MSELLLKEISLFAGTRADGQPVMETLLVSELGEGIYQLVKSPGFVRGIASGDHIRVDAQSGAFQIIKRSGNLCVRVIARQGIAQIAQQLVPLLEKMGGSLDTENERMLVFSIHVSLGFEQIEKRLNGCVGRDENSTWLYGNVYETVDGEARPLNWWQEILKPQ